MRMRTIHTQFWANEDLAAIQAEGRLLFIGLWMLADREGRLKDRPHWIGTQIFPYVPVDVEGLLASLVERGFVIRYEVDGQKYLEIQNFAKYQKPHPNETGSKIPARMERSSPNGESDVHQGLKPLQPKVEAVSTNGGNGFPSVCSVYSDSLILGESESLTDARASQAPPAPDEPLSLPSQPGGKPAQPTVFRELARLQAEAEEHWPKGAAVEQGMDEIRTWVLSRGSPTAALLDVRKGFEAWVRAVPPEGLTPDDLENWPNLETWAKKSLWRDPPRRLAKGRAGPQVVGRDREAMVRKGMEMALAKQRGA